MQAKYSLVSELSRDGLVVSVSPSHAVGRVFSSQTGHAKDHHKNDTNIRVDLKVQHDSLKDRVV